MCIIIEQEIVLALVFNEKIELKNLKCRLASSMVQFVILYVSALVLILSW